MMEFDAEQLRAVITSITGIEKFEATPIGNHELQRHLVYLIEPDGQKPLVMKLYYKKNRRNREIASFKILSQSDIKSTELIRYGELIDGTEWALYDYVEGEPFDRIMDKIPYENRLEIFTDMGRELGKIHGIRKFDFFGNWDEEGNSLDNINDCTVSTIISTEFSIREIQQRELPHQELLYKAIEKIRNSYHILDCIRESRLRHNDFDGRNILVKNDHGKWMMSGILDFEQSTPGNIETDIAWLYHKYFLENKEYERCFLKGYNEYFTLQEQFYDRLGFYLLCMGLIICSWSFEIAPEYYNEGLKLIKDYL